MEAIRVENLTKVYKTGLKQERIAVSDLSFTVKRGTITGLLGPNGAGKTTTLKVLVGLLRPTAGYVEILGIDGKRVEARKKLGFLPELPYFYPYLTLEATLDFYGELFRLPKDLRKERIKQLLELVGLFEHRHLLVSKFSRGMLQRLGLAQALINDPEVLILDEPASGLDPIGQKEMRNIILKLKEEGKTIFLSSHQLSDVELVCDYISVLNKGRLIEQGKVDELLRVRGEVEVVVEKLKTQDIEALKNFIKEAHQKEDTTSLIIDEKNLYAVIDKVKRLEAGLVSVSPRKLSLEDFFLKMLEKEGKSAG